LTDLGAGDFIHVIGQAYINKAHVKAIQKQLQISPKPFPVSTKYILLSLKSGNNITCVSLMY